jgi:hypothetical protein
MGLCQPQLQDRGEEEGVPTSFLWIHAVLITASLAIGTAVGVLGVRAWRAAARTVPRPSDGAENPGTTKGIAPTVATPPKD